MNNLDMPAMANDIDGQTLALLFDCVDMKEVCGFQLGFTKREQACLTMGVADSGDAGLDAIIEQGNKQRLAGLAMQCLLAQDDYTYEKCAEYAIKHGKTLLQQLKGDV